MRSIRNWPPRWGSCRKIDLTDVQGARDAMKQLYALRPTADTTGVTVTYLRVPGPAGAPDVAAHRPSGRAERACGVLDVHGGGFVVGDLDLVA